MPDSDIAFNDEAVLERLGLRPQNPSPLSLEEHQQLGAEMRSINARLQALCKLLVSVYGPHNQAAFTFIKTAEHVNRLCLDLQAQAARDFPGYPVDGLYI